MVDYLNFVKNAGMGAFWEGQNQQDKLNNSNVARMLQEAQAQETRGRETRAQAMHPLDIAAKQASTDLTKRQVSAADYKLETDKQENQRKAAENFFKYLTKDPTDIKGAVAYSGVPPQFAQRFEQMEPLDRDRLLQEMETRGFRAKAAEAGATKKAEAEAQQPYELARIQEQGKETRRTQQEITDRQIRLEEMRQQARILISTETAKLRAQSKDLNDFQTKLNGKLFELMAQYKVADAESKAILGEQILDVQNQINSISSQIQINRASLQPQIPGMPTFAPTNPFNTSAPANKPDPLGIR